MIFSPAKEKEDHVALFFPVLMTTNISWPHVSAGTAWSFEPKRERREEERERKRKRKRGRRETRERLGGANPRAKENVQLNSKNVGVVVTLKMILLCDRDSLLQQRCNHFQMGQRLHECLRSGLHDEQGSICWWNQNHWRLWIIYVIIGMFCIRPVFGVDVIHATKRCT